MRYVILILLLSTSCKQYPSSIDLGMKADMIIESAERTPPDTGSIVRVSNSLYADDKYVCMIEQRVRDYEQLNIQNTTKLYKSFYIAGAILLVLGIFMLTYNQVLLGTGAISSAIALVALTTVLQTYLWIVALVALGIISILLCKLGYSYFNISRALKDSITSVEVLKDSGTMWEDNVPLIEKIQHPNSKKIIQSIKNKEIRL